MNDKLFVLFARTSTSRALAFSVVDPSVSNELTLLPRVLSDTFCSSLKTVLFSIYVKPVFYVFFNYFYKNAFFNVFLFLERFLFSSGEIFYPIKPAEILLNL